ncbi:DNA repair protein RadC [Akkermansiaceae bacterium]|nr:DNA repair protein RadC [Akkermansiaceae bacterium]MDA7888631.1 DNA repair protein RadC [Akkermansiaceae bacterium]MDB4538074.1 DNA repair protein RadC [Akkermansiaceae bacterium]
MSENTRIHDLPDEQRPREKMASLGPGALSNDELLAIFLRTGTKGASAIEIGRQLITKHGSVAALAKLDLHELRKEHGLGLAKACQLQAAFELGSRAVREGSKSTPLKNSQHIYDFLAPQLSHLPTEKLFVLSVDSRLNLIRMRELSSGSTNSTVACIRDVLRPVIIDQAHAFIIAHNHPSGDTTPSTQDQIFTSNLAKAAKQMELPLIDHLIIGRPIDGAAPYFSFFEHDRL